MHAIIPSEIMRTFPANNIAVLRLNFRGVGNSQGSFEDGVGEVLDALAGIKTMHDILEGIPLILVGSSFGADTAFSTVDERVDAWCGCAPGLRDEKIPRFQSVADDPRPKLLVLAERDEIRAAQDALDITNNWNNTTTVVLKGATHFLVGRVEDAVSAIQNFVVDTANSKTGHGQ